MSEMHYNVSRIEVGHGENIVGNELCTAKHKHPNRKENTIHSRQEKK